MHILYVENHAAFAATVVPTFLAEHSVTVATTVEEALALRGTFDVVLVDYDLDDGKGDAVVEALRARGFPGTLVGVSSHAAGNAALLRAGADSVCAKLDFDQIADHLP